MIEKSVIYNGSVPILKGKKIWIIGQTAKFYKFRIPKAAFPRTIRNLLWHHVNTIGGMCYGKVAKHNVTGIDILPDDMFTI